MDRDEALLEKCTQIQDEAYESMLVQISEPLKNIIIHSYIKMGSLCTMTSLRSGQRDGLEIHSLRRHEFEPRRSRFFYFFFQLWSGSLQWMVLYLLGRFPRHLSV